MVMVEVADLMVKLPYLRLLKRAIIGDSCNSAAGKKKSGTNKHLLLI